MNCIVEMMSVLVHEHIIVCMMMNDMMSILYESTQVGLSIMITYMMYTVQK